MVQQIQLNFIIKTKTIKVDLDAQLRLRLFQPKTNFEITFTPLCVFGSNRKYVQMENQLHVDHKITHFSLKTNATFILPSNDFRDLERERERERENRWSPSQALAAQIVPPPPPRSRRPTAQIAPTKLPPISLFFLNSSSPSYSMSPIWPPPTTSPLHSTPKPTLYAGEFPPLFEFCLSPTTSPHLRSTHLRPAVTLPHVDEAIPASKSRPTLYKSRSTSLQTHLDKIHP